MTATATAPAPLPLLKHPTPEAEIRQLLEAWAAALMARDIDALMAHYAPDAVIFDSIPPQRMDSPAEYRRFWEDCLPAFPEGFRVEMRRLQLRAEGLLALAHLEQRILGMEERVPETRAWYRTTIALAREGGRGPWRIIHEHQSVPFDPYTHQAEFEYGHP